MYAFPGARRGRSTGSARRKAIEGRLVFDDLGDGAHGAFLDTVTARDAGVFIDDLYDAPDHLEDLLRTGINADSATDTFICFDDWMGHGLTPFPFESQIHLWLP